MKLKWRRAAFGHQLMDGKRVAAIVERTNGGHWIAQAPPDDGTGAPPKTKVWPPGSLAVAKRWAEWAVTGEGDEPLGAVRMQVTPLGRAVGQ